MIPYAHQEIDESDLAAVIDVLRSDWLTQGPAIERFENAVAAYCGAKHAVAMSSATAALHLACKVLTLGSGDVLWTSPNTFVASANCALYCGASVDFVDIDPSTYNISVPALEQKLEWARRAGRLPKVVVPVHFAGQPCDMPAIGALARRYGFRVIEDASHAIGARNLDRTQVGAGAHSDVTVFSFHPVKIITTGEGGMAVTNDAALAERLRLLRSHGVTRDGAQMEGWPEGGWYYEQVDLGFNYRITDMQAALGASQLARIEHFLARRAELAALYGHQLSGLTLRCPMLQPGVRSAWHLYVIQLVPEAGAPSRAQVFARMWDAGIGVNVHYIPVHLQPFYRRMGFSEGQFPAAEAFYSRALTLPLYYRLSESELDNVCGALRRALVPAGR
jgi:UDP-4-amino-4,6-dideoxy-N-acetyl-beta-L-altrosamine transaminase